jgi:hypothetical protein
MAHESMESYYTNNFEALFHRDFGFVNRFTLSDFDNMLPYERDVYLMLIGQKINEYNKK